MAEPLIDAVVKSLSQEGATVAVGRFRAHMVVALANEGPVTLVIEV